MKHNFYVGTYTQGEPGEPERSEGIWLYSLDEESGVLECVKGFDGGSNPSFLCMDPDGRFLYVANETTESQVSAFKVDSKDGGLTLLSRQETKGMHACHVCLSPSGRNLLVANYSSGNLTVLPVRGNGSLAPLSDLVQHTGSGPNAARQEHAHAHSMRIDPTGQFVLAADLGVDRVFVYKLDKSAGKLLLHDGESGAANPGAGPRHMEWNPNGQILYVANELDSTVAVYDWDANSGSLKLLNSLSTLPEGFSGESIVADIHLTPNGQYLYVSNRGSNSLAAFSVDAGSGLLHKIAVYSCGGNWPRNFAIDPDGKYLLVANQYSNNLVEFVIQSDGTLVQTGAEVEVAAPVCVLFVP